MLLNQTDTGRRNDTHANALRRSVQKEIDNNNSLMQHVPVYAFELAMTLDRLEYLEKYKENIEELFKKFNNV